MFAQIALVSAGKTNIEFFADTKVFPIKNLSSDNTLLCYRAKRDNMPIFAVGCNAQLRGITTETASSFKVMRQALLLQRPD